MRKYYMARRILFFALFIFPLLSIGQEFEPIEYGWVSEEEMEMETYADDPSAKAVILFDYCAVNFEQLTRTPVVRYTFHRRIKILTDNVDEYTKVKLNYSLDRGESISQIKGATYQYNANGDLIPFRIDRRKVRSAKINKSEREISFELPFVKKGAVVEYSYVVRSKNFDQLRTWNFQQALPVVRSEYHTLIPDTYDYLKRVMGNQNQLTYFAETYQQASRNLDLFQNDFERGGYGGQRRIFGYMSGVHEVYVMLGVPAYKQEAFAPETGQSSFTTVSLELSRDFLNRRRNSNVFEDWASLSEKTLKKYKLKKIRGKNAGIQALASRQTRRIKSNRQKIGAIYDYVRNTYTWNKEYTLNASNLKRLIAQKKGSGAEINLLLMYMLREAGLDAYPILISTRNHGKVQSIYPTLAQFNHIIVGVQIGGEDLLMDGLDKETRLGILPRNDLNELGFLLDGEGGRWVKLQSRNRINKTTYSRFNLSSNGILTGDISVENQEYSAAVERGRLTDLSGEYDNYLRQYVLTGMKKANIYEKSVLNEGESEAPLIVNCELSTRDFVRQEGDFMFIQPMMVKTVAENPFLAEERISPVDLARPFKESHMLGLRIPRGYMVAQLPQPIRVVLPNNAGIFVYNVLEMGNILHLSSTIYLNKTTFMPEEYQGVRSFFEYVVNKHQEDIILKRIQ